MKKPQSVLLLIMVLIFAFTSTAFASKAAYVDTNADSAYHAAHLLRHLGEIGCHASGNYIKTRSTADTGNDSNVIGHLEQADEFFLLELSDGMAHISITYSDSTSPDSWIDMSGWVNADYVQCQCSPEDYFANDGASANGFFSILPGRLKNTWTFASGVGAWSTEITLHTDGSFSAYYHDTDMGTDGEGYQGTVYESSFSGQFSNLRQLDEFSYGMTVSAVNVLGVVDDRYIENGVLHITTPPAGLDTNDEIIIYLPGTPENRLPENFKGWVYDYAGGPLQSFGLCNITQDISFF